VLAAIAKDVRDLQVTSTATPLGDGSAPVVRPPPSVVQRANVIPGNSKGNSGLSTGNDWAAIAYTPHNHGSRFSVLTTDDDGDSADGQPFTVVDRRRSVKRARQRSSSPQVTATQLSSQHL